jgi:hypothetical protein
MISAFARNLLLNWMLTAGAATRPTTWFISLHTGDPGTTGANELLVGTDADYVRKAVAFATSTAGQSPNSDAQSFTAAAGATTHNITHIGIWDAATAGNFILGGALTVPENRVASSTMVLAAGRGVARLT